MKKIIQVVTDKINVKELANLVRNNIQARISNSENADGTKMKPLDRKTIEIKKKRGGISPNTPLVFKGGTRKGIKSQTISKKEAVIVSTGEAKGYYGGGISSKKVLEFQRDKGRDPFAVSKEDVKDVVKLVKKQLGR